MRRVEKLVAALRLRAEAEALRRHGWFDFFEHTYACVSYGQVEKEPEAERCGPCPLEGFVPEGYREEAFRCQHIGEEGWLEVAKHPELAEEYAAWLLRSAEQLEAEVAALAA